MRELLRMVALGAIATQDVAWLVARLVEIFPSTRVTASRRPFPSKLIMNPVRGQFEAVRALDASVEPVSPPGTRTLALIDQDLYTEDLNFVFGLAQPSRRRAIVALPRLHESFYRRHEQQQLFRARLLKEAVHELGHTYGLGHCASRRCVMYFSNTLSDTDFKSANFCSSCSVQIKFGT